MVRRQKEKTLTLAFAVAVLMLAAFCHPAPDTVGIHIHCGIVQRLVYSFFHASIVHTLLNVWCLLSVVFIYNVRLSHLALAFLIAVLTPSCVLSDTPTVGLSALCFALLGLIIPQVKDKIYYNTTIAAMIAVGFFFPGINGAIHLYSYVAGLLVGLINTPIPCKRK